MKIVILLALLVSLVSCGAIDREVARLTGDGSKTCMDGVTYYQFTSGASVAYNTDGTLKLCK